MNNLFTLGVNKKYLSFYVWQESIPYQFCVYNKDAHMLSTQLTLYFQGNITCRNLDTCQFFGILFREVSSWIWQHTSSLLSNFFKVKYFFPIRKFYHNRHHSTHYLTWWWTLVPQLLIYYDLYNHPMTAHHSLLKDKRTWSCLY